MANRGPKYTMKDYTGADLTTVESFIASLNYLRKKRKKEDAEKPLAIIPWVIGMLSVWTIVFAMYYGF